MSRRRATTLLAGSLCAFQCVALAAPQGVAHAQQPAPAAARAPAAAPEPQPTTTFRARTESVLVDVVVLDGDGAPIEGLTPGDFTVTVEDTARPVTTAAYVSYAKAAQPAAGAPAEIEEGYATNQGVASPRLLVFAIDESHVRPMAAKGVLETAAGMLDALAPQDLVAVARLPRLTQGQDFTTDRAAVKAALAQVTGRGQPFKTPMYGLTLGVAVEFLRGIGPTRQEVLDTQCQNRGSFAIGRPQTGESSPVQKCIAEISGESRALVDDFTMTAKDAAYGLERLMETLAKLPGRKRVILFSEGLYVGTELRLLSRAEALASQAQATVTVIRPESALHDASASGPAIVNDPTEQVLERGLDEIAGATGGTLVKVIGSGKSAFDRIAREISGYYTIGFTPEAADRDGRRHSVKVGVAKRGVTVRARREFVIDDSQPLPSADDRLRRLLGSTVMDVGLPLRVAMLASPVPGGKVRAFVQSIVGRDGETVADPQAAAAVVDPSGAVVASFGLEPARLNPSDPRAGRLLGGARDLDPGEYRLRVAAVLPDGRAGSVEAPLALKPRQAGELSYSDLMIGLRPDAGQAFRPLPDPVVDRELVMAVELVSADPEQTGATAVQFEIAERSDGEPLVEHAVDVPQGRRAATAAASLELTLRPGTYVARARVIPREGDAIVLTKRFTVVPSGEAASVLGPRVDETKVPAPALFPFRRDHAVDLAVIAPFLDHVAKAFPPGRAGAALITKARVGDFTVPASSPTKADAVAYALVRGLAALRDGTPSACVSAFNEAIEQADGFIGFALFQGDCYAASGHDRDAVAAWEMALLGNVGTPVIYEHLVDGWLRLGDGEQALAALAEGDLVWTDRRGFDMRRGLALALLDRHQEALPLLETAASDPSAGATLLFVTMRSMHAGRKAGWLESSDATLQRYDGYLERYAAANGPQLDVAKSWRKAFTK